ncbi:MAG: hypothetical protein WAO95_15525 [Burkholderiales bacterium]
MAIRRSFLPIAELVLLALAGGAVAQDGRPALREVSAIRVGNYGSPSVLLEGREKAGPIVSELNALRGKAWRGGDTKLECYATLIVISGKKTLATFRIRPEHIVERVGPKGVPVYSLALGPVDLPRVSKLLTEIPPPKDCS